MRSALEQNSLGLCIVDLTYESHSGINGDVMLNGGGFIFHEDVIECRGRRSSWGRGGTGRGSV